METQVICIKNYNINFVGNHEVYSKNTGCFDHYPFKKGDIYQATDISDIGRNRVSGKNEIHVISRDLIVVFNDEYFQTIDEYIQDKIKEVLCN